MLRTIFEFKRFECGIFKSKLKLESFFLIWIWLIGPWFSVQLIVFQTFTLIHFHCQNLIVPRVNVCRLLNQTGKFNEWKFFLCWMTQTALPELTFVFPFLNRFDSFSAKSTYLLFFFSIKYHCNSKSSFMMTNFNWNVSKHFSVFYKNNIKFSWESVFSYNSFDFWFVQKNHNRAIAQKPLMARIS